MKGIYEIERQYGKGAHLYWMEVRGGIRGRHLDEPYGSIGVILGPNPANKDEQVILRTITGVVNNETMQKLDTAILTGTVALPPAGNILDSSSLLVQNAPMPAGPMEAGAR